MPFWGALPKGQAESSRKDDQTSEVNHDPPFFGTGPKDTIFRCWNTSSTPSPNNPILQCTRAQGVNTCGRPLHDILEFGATATRPTAAYPPQLCSFVSDLLIKGARSTASAVEARQSAAVVAECRVKRHLLRGETVDGARYLKRAEDEKALAGMRNPASVCKDWPSLVEAMRPVQVALLSYQRGHPEFQGLGGVCGANPSRAPPSDKGVKALQAKVAKAVGI